MLFLTLAISLADMNCTYCVGARYKVRDVEFAARAVLAFIIIVFLDSVIFIFSEQMISSFTRISTATILKNLRYDSAVFCSFYIRSFSSASDVFTNAQAQLKTLKEEPDNTVKLQLYALFKQVVDNVFILFSLICRLAQEM